MTPSLRCCLSLARNKNGRAKEANHDWLNFSLALIFQTKPIRWQRLKMCASWITEVTSLLLENSVCQALVPLFTKFNLCLLMWNMKYPPLSLSPEPSQAADNTDRRESFISILESEFIFSLTDYYYVIMRKFLIQGQSQTAPQSCPTLLASLVSSRSRRTLFIVILTHPNNCINVVLFSEKFRHKKHI